MEEIKGILFNMNVDSATGPDRYTTKFFKTTWSITANDVFHAVQNDFSTISLCTVFYKLLSKLLMSRLSGLLPKIISPFQMGFVKGRAIADNILLAQEFCQDLDIKVRGGNMVMKLDITKAYDNINWSFIYKILSLFSFDLNFIKLIKSCIESPFYSIMVNGKSHGYFQASHGLRQGDPLSPAILSSLLTTYLGVWLICSLIVLVSISKLLAILIFLIYVLRTISLCFRMPPRIGLGRF
ncbi:integrator complex subunit 11 [Dendrobium catenatum]|uniref:Integrator complex subunit 11 n=1 Tax=Dendrobium catenatum TaxID=906689 RepID=A0A2I0VBJ6_9ASPA|nr:integrator complex subunit 11 [Dendrobium catenatum]